MADAVATTASPLSQEHTDSNLFLLIGKEDNLSEPNPALNDVHLVQGLLISTLVGMTLTSRLHHWRLLANYSLDSGIHKLFRSLICTVLRDERSRMGRFRPGAGDGKQS